MLPLLDARYAGYNADMLALYAHERRPAPAERRTAYLRALLQLQRQPILFDEGSPHFRVDFDLDDPIVRAAVVVLLDGRALQADSSCAAEAPVITARVRAAESLLARYSRSAFSTLHLLIGSLMIARLPDEHGSGSSNGNLLGGLWLSPQPAWTAVDYAETILHEGLHQSIFLDDMVNRTFALPPAAFDAAAYQTPSPSLKRLRPYDLAFHSSLVVAALVDFYAVLQLPRPLRLERSFYRLPESVTALRARADVLTAHGQTLLGLLEDELRRLQACAPHDAVS
jgi:hypothetical protein